MFSGVGQVATLSCANVLKPDCSTTTWIQERSGQRTVEVVKFGNIISSVCTDNPKSDNCDRSKRLSLHTSCSLHITDVISEDAGRYICRQYEKNDGTQTGTDAHVYLTVLCGKFCLFSRIM